MTFFLGHGTRAKWQTPSVGLSYRPIALLPSLVQILALPLARQHISFVAPTTRPGMVLPTMPQSLPDSTERAKEKMLPWICVEGEAGNWGEDYRLGCANDSNACGSWTMEQSQSNSCSLRLSTYFGLQWMDLDFGQHEILLR